MKCDRCGQTVESGRTCEWIAGDQVASHSHHEGASTVTRTTYTNFSPVYVSVCETCFQAAKKHNLLWKGIFFFGSLGAFALVFFIMFLIDRMRAGSFKQLLTIGGALAIMALFWTVVLSLVYLIKTIVLTLKIRPKSLEEILEPECKKKVTQAKHTHFWTKKAYEKLKAQSALHSGR